MEVTELATLLTSNRKTVSVAEACTCGLVGYMMSTVPGSSIFFPGGVIAYTGGLKQSLLGVPDELYETSGSVSAEMAVAMAKGVKHLTGTDYGISTTGVTGPTQGKSTLPIGTFYIGLVGPDGLEISKLIHTDSGERDGNKRQAAQAVLDLLGRTVSES
ncbi:nicotinamide-nucleotide amidohydrolase family protein [SAR202 cluster bacterium AD-804-J14_MRT_500m]|nr:nicotinamide-nucleotide amidohydrolase family protein [SAR202 cluster bacterium AD-804-J14_MRT_500m]